MAQKAKLNTLLLFQNSEITKELRDLGYVGTICASVHTKDGSLKFQDLHVTREQIHRFIANVSYILCQESEMISETDTETSDILDSIEHLYRDIPFVDAHQLLLKAGRTISSRGNEYDPSGGNRERSMHQIVTAFNAIAKRDLTEYEGWVFMQVLKIVRQANSPTFHEDSAIDSIAYAALAAECGFNSRSDR